MLILVTNDDGVQAEGLHQLAEALRPLGRVVVVAPDRNRSAVGHALTLEHPLRVEQLADDVYAIDGTPTDCVNLGVHGLLRQHPDLIVSGINRGSNVGDDITYSGTVCAALEGSLMGLPALAVSLDAPQFSTPALTIAAHFATALARQVIAKGLPAETFLNVNVPSGSVNGARLTRQGKRRYGQAVVCNRDPRGRDYYWIGGSEVGFEDIPGSDCNALAEGYISVTPLKTDLTHDAVNGELSGWDFNRLLED